MTSSQKSKRARVARAAFVLTASCLASTASAQTVIVNDTFSDNERATQNLAGSAEWAYAPNGANANTTLSASTGALVYTPTVAAAQYSTAYFTASGSPLAIATGETLTLSFTFSASTLVNLASGLQFGLFDSAGTRYAAGYSGAAQTFANNAIFGPSTGYFTRVNLGNNSGVLELREEFASGSKNTYVSASTALGTPGVSNLSLAVNTPYTASLSITNNGATMSVSSTINGVTVSGTDTATLRTSFDTIGLFTSGGTVPVGQSFTFDNINVTYSAIPEPSAFAALAGVAMLGAAALRRRRRVA